MHTAGLLPLLSGAMQEAFAWCELPSAAAGRATDARVLELNDAFARLVGLPAAEVRGRDLCGLLPEEGKAWLPGCYRAVRTGAPARLPAGPQGPAGGWEARVHPQGPRHFLLLLDAPRACREEPAAAEQSLLRLLGRHGGPRELARSLAGYLQRWSGCEAVGIRLQDGDDFPYCETRGFPPGILPASGSLCRRDVERDESGEPVLPCMCGAVLAGRAGAGRHALTAGGSFWTNCFSRLPAPARGSGGRSCACSRCRQAGYESVALVPLRAHRCVFGLLQLSDRRRDRFTPEFIRSLEELAGPIAWAIDQRQRLTALRERETQFQRVVEHAPIPVLVYAEDGRVLAMSRAVTRLTGYRRRDVRTFEDWTRLAYGGAPAQMEEVRRIVHWMFDSGQAIPQAERVVTTRCGGKRVWLFAEAEPHRFASGARYHIAIAVDITDRKEAEHALQRVNEQLERRVSERTAVAERRARQLQAVAVQLIEAEERERQRIGAILHDDLQQILAAAKRKLFWLKNVPDDLAGLMEEAIQKARSLSYELSPSVLRYAGFTATLEWLARQMKEQHGLEVVLETGAWKDEAAEPVKVALFRAVKELLFNVVKHAGVQQASISLSRARGRLKVTVADTGRGFDPRALEPGEECAAGVGLVSIRERIASLGGSLAIHSSRGHGSRFTLTVPYKLKFSEVGASTGGVEQRLPVTAPSEAGGLPKRRVSRRAPGEATPVPDARFRVLFADDHKVVREGLIAMLENQPDILVVGEAANGRQAVELARELLPDVIVMDVSMPAMDGIEATRRIRTEMPGIRVIGLSMFDEKEVVERMVQAGAETCISKTSSSSSILQLIYGLAPHAGSPARPPAEREDGVAVHARRARPGRCRGAAAAQRKSPKAMRKPATGP